MVRIREELIDRIKEKDARIAELLQRIKEAGDMNDSEMKNLHQSFHQIETEKETMVNEYQANISFLNQQIAKLTNANELKNNEIKQLHEEIGHIRRLNSENIRDLEENWREERREREEERDRERERREKIFDEQRTRER